jgi:hypothetical protein
MTTVGLVVGGHRGLYLIGLEWSVCVFDGKALLLQEGERVEALVRVAVWSRREGEAPAWSGHFLHPVPPGVLKLGRARLQLPGLAEAAIEIDYRASGTNDDLGGDFSGVEQPPTTAGLSLGGSGIRPGDGA